MLLDAGLWTPGEHTLRVDFEKAKGLGVEGIKYTNATGGNIRFTLDGTPVGAVSYKLGATDGETWEPWTPADDNAFITQPGKFALCGEGMNIGRDAGQSVSRDFECPNAFTSAGGITLEKVEVTIVNDGATADQALEYRGMLWRD